MDEPYIDDPKDLRDLNMNIKLLIQKFNHEHSNVVKDVSYIKSDMDTMKSKVECIENGFNEFMNKISGMNLMLKILMGILSATGILIGIGVSVS